jgi:hypothetical protein
MSVMRSGVERSDSAENLMAACKRVCKRVTGKDRPDKEDERGMYEETVRD